MTSKTTAPEGGVPVFLLIDSKDTVPYSLDQIYTATFYTRNAKRTFVWDSAYLSILRGENVTHDEIINNAVQNTANKHNESENLDPDDLIKYVVLKANVKDRREKPAGKS